MPIYDFRCQSCGHTFEALVRGASAPVCASCGAGELERLMSLPNVKSEITTAKSLRAAQKRDQAQGAERVHTQREYERNHD